MDRAGASLKCPRGGGATDNGCRDSEVCPSFNEFAMSNFVES